MLVNVEGKGSVVSLKDEVEYSVGGEEEGEDRECEHHYLRHSPFCYSVT